jgi:formylglycine-generating enzyme required for sulfatase activity
MIEKPRTPEIEPGTSVTQTDALDRSETARVLNHATSTGRLPWTFFPFIAGCTLVLIVGIWTVSQVFRAVDEPAQNLRNPLVDRVGTPGSRPLQKHQHVESDEVAAAVDQVTATIETAKAYTNSLGTHFVLIPAGKFLMGNQEPIELVQQDYDTRYTDYRNEYPVHEVKITQSFYMSSCEVTQAEFERVLGVNPSYFSENGHSKQAVAGIDTGRFPVENVSWHDAVEFCRQLSALPAERQANAVYRLPTEAEWEYAARGGTSGRYSFDGTDFSTYLWCGDNSENRTHEVATLEPNPFGLYDMHGNVTEWCHDWYGLYPDLPQTDPVGPAESVNKRRVIRGGSWMHIENLGQCRSSNRSFERPRSHRSVIGFRLVLELDGS